MKLIGFKDAETFAEIIKADSLEVGDNVHVVVAEMPDQQGIMQHFIGIEKAQQLVEESENNLVILTSFMPLSFLATREHFHETMADPRVLFIRLPFSGEELKQTLKNYEISPRPVDELAKKLGSIKRTNDAVNVLIHNGRYLVNLPDDSYQKKEWLEKAKQFFGQGSFDEIWAKVTSDSAKMSSELAGQTFPDVCVDVEGTLFTRDGVLRTEVLEIVKSYEATNPITVWTGGDVSELEKLLRKHGLIWKILPKAALRGATVKIIIDDLSETEFSKHYGVNCHKYLRV